MGSKNLLPLRTRSTRPTLGLTRGDEFLAADKCLEMHRIMVRARLMEERMIKMSKSGEGYFWIGGPGEEAFNAALGLQVKKGEGPDYDFLHLHYRNSATMIAMGMTAIDGIRQMAMTATDPFSRGRNFPGHYSVKAWNVAPIMSVIGIQWVKAPGSAIVQKRHGGDAITVVVGGDAGTAEGDFHSCMVWSTRPGNELPVLMIVMNNGWGISTSFDTQHAEKSVIERGKPFGIRGEIVDGNDAVASWSALERAMTYVREQRRPFMIEARVSRLYGHSSSSGAPRSADKCCIDEFENSLLEARLVSREALELVHHEAHEEVEAAVAQVAREKRPEPEDIVLHTYAHSPVDTVYPNDYTGLPS